MDDVVGRGSARNADRDQVEHSGWGTQQGDADRYSGTNNDKGLMRHRVLCVPLELHQSCPRSPGLHRLIM